jgi:uncharacterized damage-inducible protein DinB
MMDEYERAVREMMAVFASIDQNGYESIRDTNTKDENCRSIQTIMSHVVSAGYSYADYFRAAFGISSRRPPKRPLSFSEVPAQMEKMIDYTLATLQEKWEMEEDQIMAVRIESSWGQTYDLEQMMEHGIVHVLRHRRQIQRMLA